MIHLLGDDMIQMDPLQEEGTTRMLHLQEEDTIQVLHLPEERVVGTRASLHREINKGQIQMYHLPEKGLRAVIPICPHLEQGIREMILIFLRQGRAEIQILTFHLLG